MGGAKMPVTQLGYLGFNIAAEKQEAWYSLAAEILGCEIRERADECSPLCLRLDNQHHRIALYPGNTDGLAYIGWEVGSQTALEDLADRLIKHGIKVRRGSPEERM